MAGSVRHSPERVPYIRLVPTTLVLGVPVNARRAIQLRVVLLLLRHRQIHVRPVRTASVMLADREDLIGRTGKFEVRMIDSDAAITQTLYLYAKQDRDSGVGVRSPGCGE